MPEKLYSNWQAPGPPGWPQLPQGAGISLCVSPAPAIAAKVDIFFLSSVPWQLGHSGAGADWRTSVSNSFPQELHAYSNIGMISMLP